MVHAFSIEMQNQIYDMKEVFINKMSFNIIFLFGKAKSQFYKYVIFCKQMYDDGTGFTIKCDLLNLF